MQSAQICQHKLPIKIRRYFAEMLLIQMVGWRQYLCLLKQYFLMNFIYWETVLYKILLKSILNTSTITCP